MFTAADELLNSDFTAEQLDVHDQVLRYVRRSAVHSGIG
jgi:hypothetical protein